MVEHVMWMVRAGEGAFFVDEFRQKSIVAIGWEDVGDLSGVSDYQAIRRLVEDAYPDAKDGNKSASAGQLRRFRLEFKVGDRVVSYDPQKRSYLVGEITSDYQFKPDLRFPHIREVKWLGEIARDSLSPSTKNTLGAISTIFTIGSDAESEIVSLLQGEEPVPVEDNLEVLKEDMISKAHEFIADKMLALDWDDMQELVAGLLRAMGYKTIVSPKGSDRGKDILASPDGLGLEEPRIKVEVKHRAGSMGSQEIRSFTGGLRPGDRGLYVSTGGFSRDSRYEADRSNIPLTLIDADMLVQLIVQNYDNFDSDTKTLLPLTKIYWPS